jgi:putative SOS response-associated peptidase YedK
VALLHDRMPLIVPPASYARWIDPAIRLTDLGSLEPAALVSHSVSTYVNSPANDDAKCIEPGTAAQGSLFG